MQPLYAWIRVHRWGLIVGTAVTLTTAALYSSGGIAPLSLWLLDYKFRHFNRAVDDQSIVMIDINDYSLERVHSWPWPRQYHSDLIQTLTELGARAVLMDIVFAEPKGGRVVDPRLDPDHEVDPGEIFGEFDEANVVQDDDVFVNALSEAGNVYLAMFARLYHPGHSPEALRVRAYGVLNDHPGITYTEFDVRLNGALSQFAKYATAGGRRVQRFEPAEIFDSLRIEHLLEGDFRLDLTETAARLGLPDAIVEQRFAGTKRNVARRLVRDYRRKHPQADWLEVFRRFMPDSDLSIFSSDREDLLRAFRAVSAERVVVDGAIPVEGSMRGKIPYASDLTFPVEKFTEVAHVGLVSFETNIVDGVMRRVPLVVNVRGRLLEHLGFAVACDVLDIDQRTIRVERGKFLSMTTHQGDRRWRIPLDEDGRTLINWHIHPRDREWTHSFDHIPVARMMAIPTLRRAIEEEEGLYAHQMQEFVKIAASVADAKLAKYQDLVRERKELRSNARTPDELKRLETVNARIERAERESIDFVEDLASQVEEHLAAGGTLSADNEQDRQALQVRDLADRYRNDPGAGKLKRAIADKGRRIEELKGLLQPRIEGRICLVGYTAAAVADTVNTPVFDEMPGVLAHANVINSMLANEFPRVAPMWVNVLLVVVSGLMITVVTTWRDPWFSVILMFGMITVLLGAALAAFMVWMAHIKLEAAAIGVFVTWALVTLYRQLTEERHKRAISNSLAQYTSPAIAQHLAAQVMRSGRADIFSPVSRVVTCFFSDLKGFTSISERLGASGTRELLNPYLKTMSQVLNEDRAIINKFIGDGIFAFFNPPVRPVQDHAVAACEAALRSFDALERLKEEIGHGHSEGREEFRREIRALSMRIGLNSGEVFVGDYGSGNKLDYTCIGDTVNLAARLEPACKVFGVRCLISETTLQDTGDRFIVRHLGGLQVVGKKEAVQVYELIGRRDEVNGELEFYADLYGQAVAMFQRRDWDGTMKVLDECRVKRPEDMAIDLLAGNVRRHQLTPPPEGWNQAIELTTK